MTTALCRHTTGSHRVPTGDLLMGTTVYTRCAAHRAEMRKHFLVEDRGLTLSQAACTKCHHTRTAYDIFEQRKWCSTCRAKHRSRPSYARQIARQNERFRQRKQTREKRAERGPYRTKARRLQTALDEIRTCTDPMRIAESARVAASEADPTDIRIAAVVRKLEVMGDDEMTPAEWAMLKKATVSSNDRIGVPE